MITRFNYSDDQLYTPVIFRSDFQVATLDATQAWSLFFTAGQEENQLGTVSENGWFCNNVLTAIVVAGAIGASIFTSSGLF